MLRPRRVVDAVLQPELWAGRDPRGPPHDDRTWATLCLELSPAGTPMIVPVVTRGTSDDADAFVVDGPSVRLRVARIGRLHAFHASTDGRTWQLVRVSGLGDNSPPVGFEARSPTGDGCTVTVDEIRHDPTHLADLRDGTRPGPPGVRPAGGRPGRCRTRWVGRCRRTRRRRGAPEPGGAGRSRSTAPDGRRVARLRAGGPGAGRGRHPRRRVRAAQLRQLPGEGLPPASVHRQGDAGSRTRPV